MGPLCLASCAVVLLLMYTQRRDRRLLARLPLLGAGLVCAALGAYVAYRLFGRPGAVSYADGRIVRAVLAAGSGFALPVLVPWGRALFRQDLPRLGRALRADTAWTCLCVLVGVLAATGYFLFGTQLGVRGVFGYIDALFDADPLYQQEAWGVAIHTQKHPLLPLMWFVALKAVAPFTGPFWAPLAINSLIGGLSVSLAAVYFRAVTGSAVYGLSAALILGCTAAHVVFGAMPESYILSAGAMIILQLPVAGRRSVRRRHIVLAALLATGITILSALPALICFVVWRGQRRWWAAAARLAAYALVIGSLLISLQLTLRPEAAPFQPRSLFGERRFVQSAPAAQRAVNVTHGVALQNVVGWLPVNGAPLGLPGLRAGHAYDPLGRATGALWGGLAAGAAWSIVRRGHWRRRTFWVALACLGAVVATYAPAAHESLFLYSCCFTFFVLAVLAHGLVGVRSRAVAVLLGIFFVLLLVNNARFCARIVSMIDQLQRATN